MTTSATDSTATRKKAPSKPNKALHIGLWVVQALLAVAFGMAGVMKTFTSLDELAQTLPWVTSAGSLVRFIGIAELLGAIGLILPAATRIKPVLTPLAAIGIATIMVLASAFHVYRGEAPAIPVNFVLGGLAVFVAWGRFRGAPILPREMS